MSSFTLTHSWQGSTADAAYSRDAEARSPGKLTILQSSGIGDGAHLDRWNPEDLLGASLVQCHTLTFLVLANKLRLDVRSIETTVTVELVTEEKLTRVGRITLDATLTVVPGTDTEKVLLMYDKAHKYCFIANSLRSEVVLKPVVVGA